MTNYREAIRGQMKSFRQLEKARKRFEKGQLRVQKYIDNANRPRDAIGRVIKLNAFDEEIVRVKQKWFLRSEVADSFD